MHNTDSFLDEQLSGVRQSRIINTWAYHSFMGKDGTEKTWILNNSLYDYS
jgi:hypothetical protein